MTENLANSPKAEAPLESWKEIAAYLQRDVTTVRRWEKKEGLPVYRHSHSSRSSVYAYASEIDAWRASRTAAVESPSPTHWWARLATPGFALAMLLSLIIAGNGFHPGMVAAQQTGQTRTLVCSGSDCGAGQVPPDVVALLARTGGDFAPVRRLQAALPLSANGPRIGWILSPDGARIAYMPMTGSGNLKDIAPSGEVSVVNADGSRSRMVFHGGRPLAWSADGRRLLIVSGEEKSELAWLDVARGTVEKLPAHWKPLKPVVSPDGRYIAFTAGKDRDSLENVVVMASDGSEETVVSPSPGYQEPVGWSPDGRNIVYQQYGDTPSLWSVAMANGKFQGPAVNIHIELGKGAQVLGISRSGALYYSILSSARDIYTASMDPATGRVTSAPVPVPVLRTGANAFPKWAPDSRRLMYGTREPAGDLELHLYSFETGAEEPLPGDPKIFGSYCWSRDGRSVLANPSSDPRRLIRLNLADGRTTPLLQDAGPFQLANCSGDLVLGRMRASTQLRSLENGTTKEVYNARQGSVVGDAAISHDSRTVAFTTAAFRGGSYGNPTAIRIVSSGGGPAREIVSVTAPSELQFGALTWSPENRFVYFTRRPDEHSLFELYRVPAAGGAPQSMGLKLDGLRDIDIAPDGTRIAFSLGSGGTQVWAVQGFLPAKR